MAWYLKSTKELWTGEIHTLHGFTWTETNHMSNSVKLEEGDAPVPKIGRPLMTLLNETLEEVEGQLVKKARKKPLKKKKVVK
tara:strand:+ start:405 stop:650 length:246 start_codon:yes stop_codon:yes gene_type:complete